MIHIYYIKLCKLWKLQKSRNKQNILSSLYLYKIKFALIILRIANVHDVEDSMLNIWKKIYVLS